MLISLAVIIVLYFFIERIYYIAILPFALIGFVTFYSYFHIEEGEAKNITARIEKVYYDGMAVGNIGNKKIEIKYEDYTFEKGKKYILRGILIKHTVIENGIVAVFNGEVVGEKEDYLYRIYEFKEGFYKKLSKIIGKNEAAIINSISFGDEGYLSKDTKNLFKDFGISHIISVSGMHISLIFQIFNKIFGILPSLIFTALYCVFVGNKT